MIRAIRLKTGEELITSIKGINKVGDTEKAGEEVIFDKPMSIHLVPQQEN